VFFCGWLMFSLPKITWVRFVVWLFVGLIIYFYYGMRHSRLGNATKIDRRT
jgi:APA family basic amino acid/polyamine antiporter